LELTHKPASISLIHDKEVPSNSATIPPYLDLACCLPLFCGYHVVLALRLELQRSFVYGHRPFEIISLSNVEIPYLHRIVVLVDLAALFGVMLWFH